MLCNDTPIKACCIALLLIRNTTISYLTICKVVKNYVIIYFNVNTC